MPVSLPRLPFARLFRPCPVLGDTTLEQDMETVVKVLQPGPLGIIEHKFTDEEIKRANSIVDRAVGNWRRAALAEQNSPVLKDFIDSKTFVFGNSR